MRGITARFHREDEHLMTFNRLSPFIRSDFSAKKSIDALLSDSGKERWRIKWPSKVLMKRDFCSIGSLPIELVRLPCFMSKETLCGARRHQRISLPEGMFVAWYGGGEQQVSRVKTLGMGGLFLSGFNALPVGTNLRLVFEVPGGSVQAEGIVRNITPSEGIGVEFTRIAPRDRVLLDRLLRRLLR
jgi:hypothetical protein